MYLVEDIEECECLYMKEENGSLKDFYKCEMQQMLWKIVGALRKVAEAARG